jgi:hypothetical protein
VIWKTFLQMLSRLHGYGTVLPNAKSLPPIPAPVRAPGTLTAAEAAEIQAIAKKYNTTIDVVGSRAAGEGRGLGTNLPVGKGKGTRSDIDLRIDTSHPDAAKIIEECNKVGNGAGNASMKHGTDHRPTYPPFIRITPEG